MTSYTLLDLVSIVLHEVGEQAVQAFNTPLSVRAKENLQQAVTHIATIANWDYLYVRQPATDWSGHVATLSNFSRIRRVEVGSLTEGFIEACLSTPDMFYRKQVLAVTNSPLSGRIEYTREGYGKFAFNPYPITSSDQNRIVFSFWRNPVIPINQNDFFDCPEEHKNLLVFYAAAQLSLSHLNDMSLYAQNLNKFEIEANTLRSRQGNPTISLSRTGRW